MHKRQLVEMWDEQASDKTRIQSLEKGFDKQSLQMSQQKAADEASLAALQSQLSQDSTKRHFLERKVDYLNQQNSQLQACLR